MPETEVSVMTLDESSKDKNGSCPSLRKEIHSMSAPITSPTDQVRKEANDRVTTTPSQPAIEPSTANDQQRPLPPPQPPPPPPPAAAKNRKNKREEADEESSIISKLSPIKMPASPTTPYMKLAKSMASDSRWTKEVNLGKRIGFYRLKGELGSGNFSQVKMAIHQLTKDKVAVKTLDRSKLDAKAQRMLSREIAIMEQLCHPNLIQLFEVVESRDSVNLIMEMADEGELFAKITNEGKMSEEKSRVIFRQIISAVDYMHSRNVIHRDLKAENIYFKGPDTIKVGDFGFSTHLNFLDEALRTFCGSPPYAAPELFQEESYIGAPVDIWALGVLLYFMICGYMPFRAATVIALKKSILEDDFDIPSQVSPQCANLIRGVLNKSHRRRYTMTHVVSSPWLRQFREGEERRPLVARRPSGQRPISGKGVPSRWMYHPWPVLEVEQRQPLETECRLRMTRYGLKDEHIEKALPHGCRDPVIGIYRITAHTVHDEMQFKRKSPTSETIPESEESETYSCNSNQQMKLRKATEIVTMKRKSRTCTIL